MDQGKHPLVDAIIRKYYQSQTRIPTGIMFIYINNLKDQGIQYYRTEVKIFCQIPSTITLRKKKIYCFR